jgi:hypothetical protein
VWWSDGCEAEEDEGKQEGSITAEDDSRKEGPGKEGGVVVTEDGRKVLEIVKECDRRSEYQGNRRIVWGEYLYV